MASRRNILLAKDIQIIYIYLAERIFTPKTMNSRTTFTIPYTSRMFMLENTQNEFEYRKPFKTFSFCEKIRQNFIIKS